MKKTFLKSIIVGLSSIAIIAAFVICFSGCSDLPNDGILSYDFSDDKSYYIVDDVINDSITEIIIPEAYNNIPIKSIGNYAFSSCDNLANITIPDSVTSIGNSAFSGCSSLTSISIPDSVTSIGEKAFYGCPNLRDLTIGNSVTSIGEDAFRSCSSLENVTIPDSVTSIGGHAFYSCKNLKTVTVGNGVTSVGSCAFQNCNSLKCVYITDVAAWCNISFDYVDANPLEYAENLYLNGEFVKELVIPNGVTNIGSGAFSGYSSLASITIPDSVTRIGENAFKDCISLKDVYITDIVAWCNISFDGSNSVPFKYADNLYLNGELVTDLVIPDAITSIGAKAFSDYKGLTSIIIPDGVTSIEDYAFYNCTSLTSINIPDSVTKVCEYAFYNCKGIKELTIGSSVTSIGSCAFDKCSSLENIVFKGTVEQWNLIDKDTSWDGVVNRFAIYCTDGTISKNGIVTYY